MLTMAPVEQKQRPLQQRDSAIAEPRAEPAGPQRGVFQDSDYFGRTVNVAARITDYARPGEVLASDQVVADTSTPLHLYTAASHAARGGRPLAFLASPVARCQGSRDSDRRQQRARKRPIGSWSDPLETPFLEQE
jgi:hypothetical protein